MSDPETASPLVEIGEKLRLAISKDCVLSFINSLRKCPIEFSILSSEVYSTDKIKSFLSTLIQKKKNVQYLKELNFGVYRYQNEPDYAENLIKQLFSHYDSGNLEGEALYNTLRIVQKVYDTIESDISQVFNGGSRFLFELIQNADDAEAEELIISLPNKYER
jgi:hypothetical protein